MLELWQEARTRFVNQLAAITPAQLTWRLGTAPNSVGFLIRHIGDVELLFAKNVFGEAQLKASAKTVIEKRDTGEWTDLQALVAYIQESHDSLASIVSAQTEADWATVISTKEFGSKTKAEALGRIISHTAYHAGQMAMILKYGNA
jgi:uncharacterized damage-inducible protein DinB